MRSQAVLFTVTAIVAFISGNWFIQDKLSFHGFEFSSNEVSELLESDDILQQLDCLALNIYREAGYEPFEGKVAVGQVTMNRVKDSRFPNTVCEVVYEKNVFKSRTICQFSWYCDSRHRNKPVYHIAYRESYHVAKKVLLEDYRLSKLENALFYHADYVFPNWQFVGPRITQIGAHIFYEGK